MRMYRTRKTGTSLVELLVVIVVFLIGILAVLQIFPGGFRVLSNTRNMAVARQLARQQSEMNKARADTMAEMILDVKYAVIGASMVDIFVDGTHNPNDLGHPGDGIDANGNVTLGASTIGRWDLVAGSNRTRRVVAEGGRVPSPRQVGSDFGGLMLLHFAPVSFDPAYPTLLQVYGNDMVRRFGAPGFRVRSWEYFVEDPEEAAAQLYLPGDATRNLSYRLTMSAWISNGVSTFRRTIVDTTIVVNAGLPGNIGSFPLSSYAALQVGETFLGAEWESIRVSRLFDRIPAANAFTPNEPYEYKLLDDRLGILLFNPAGHNYKEVRPGRRVPLVARVNYDVFDWRIIRDEFRIPTVLPLQSRLQLGNLKVKGGSIRADSRPYDGLDIVVADGSGGTETRDFLLMDMETGGLYTPDSFTLDKSLGLLTFVDATPGGTLQSRLILPGQAVPITVDSGGRAVRALYQANGEWAVQVLPAPSWFSVTYSQPSVAQYYVGGSSGAGGAPTRIYFPINDIGRKVVIGEIWYRDGGGNLKSLNDQDFVIQNAPLDPLGPYVDIATVDPNAAAFDFAQYGYAVRRVKGASVAVRVLWNPSVFTLIGDQNENNSRFDRWAQDWRRTVVDTFLQRGES
jgi:hypothetical protein